MQLEQSYLPSPNRPELSFVIKFSITSYKKFCVLQDTKITVCAKLFAYGIYYMEKHKQPQLQELRLITQNQSDLKQ